VLGSGGARGLAHIGVIRALEKAGYEIKAISGSSIGALIGGIYAMGKLDEYADWVCGLTQRDIFKLADWQLRGGGLIRGQKLICKLQELLGQCDIEDMSIKFTAVAVDLDEGKEIWLDSGPLFDAIRASIAIPGIFSPHQYHGKRLSDGGLLNPVPVAPTIRTITDQCFAVDLNADPDCSASPTPPDTALLTEAHNSSGVVASHHENASWLEEIITRFKPVSSAKTDTLQIMVRALDIMQSQLTRQNLSVYTPDLVIPIPTTACAMHEFHRASELISLGSHITERILKSHK